MPAAAAADLRPAVRRARRLLDDAGASLLGHHVLALCSGGIDSVTLVAVLARLPRGAAPRKVSVLWLDHGVRVDVDAERAAAQAAAEAHGFDFTVERTAISDRGAGVQAAAREWRYAAALRVASELRCDVVATGHTASDQLEGALLGLVGVTAAGTPAALPVSRALAPGVQLVRPLLAFDRAGVEAFAAAAELTWADDPSNDDPDAYVRNGVRHRVVPALLELAPGAGAALARAADRAADHQAALESLGSALLAAWGAPTVPPTQLDTRLLTPLAAPARHAVLASWLRGAGLGRALDARTITAVDGLVMRGSDAQVDLAGRACVRRDGYDVHFVRPADSGAPRP
jgi:tRNA(Ile)-lysidine synthase